MPFPRMYVVAADFIRGIRNLVFKWPLKAAERLGSRRRIMADIVASWYSD